MDAKTFDKSKLPSRQITRALLDGGYLHEDCLTVTGKTVKRNLENVKFNENQKVGYAVSKPISPMGGSVGPARMGAVTHAGGGAEVACYADI